MQNTNLHNSAARKVSRHTFYMWNCLRIGCWRWGERDRIEMCDMMRSEIWALRSVPWVNFNDFRGSRVVEMRISFRLECWVGNQEASQFRESIIPPIRSSSSNGFSGENSKPVTAGSADRHETSSHEDEPNAIFHFMLVSLASRFAEFRSSTK